MSVESLHRADRAPVDNTLPGTKHPAAGRAGGLVRSSVYRPSDLTFYVSPIRQRDLNRERATRDGYSIIEEFTDLDASAWRDSERPGFKAAIAALMNQEIEVLYVPKVDRLTRQGMGAIGLLLDELERVGGRIVFVAEGLDSSQPGARQIIGLLAEQARAESSNISWRAAQSREASRRLGRWASKRPYGYDVVAGKLRPRPTQAPIVRRIVEEFLAGSSLRAICRGLNADGVPSPRRAQVNDARAEGRHTKGARRDLAWGVPTIRKMLISPVLAGLQTHHGDIVRDDHGQPISVGEGIISLAEHSRVLAEMERRKPAVQRAQDATRVAGTRPTKYLLSGFLRCGECGSAMAGTLRSGRKSVYQCTRAAQGSPCRHIQIQMEVVDQAVLQTFLAHLRSLEPSAPLVTAMAERWLSLSPPKEEASRRPSRSGKVISRCNSLN